MKYALVYYPLIDHKGFHCLRYRFDPYATLLPEHLPLVFPVPESVGVDKLKDHIRFVVQNWKPIDITLKGLHLSWDKWLMLGVEMGREQITKLHDDLYSGMLKPFHRPDIEYIPHVALGLFSKDNYEPDHPVASETDRVIYEMALEKAERMELEFKRTIHELKLVKINEEYTKSWDIHAFEL